MPKWINKKMSADRLNSDITNLSDDVYMFHDEQWKLITHITNYHVIGGVWSSAGNGDAIEIELEEDLTILINKWDVLEIRYSEDNPTVDSFRKSWGQVLRGETHPIDDLWDEE